MKKLDIRKLFDLEDGDRFYFVTDKRRLVYQFERREDVPARELQGWKIEPGYIIVYYRNDAKTLFEKSHDFDVVFIRNVL